MSPAQKLIDLGISDCASAAEAWDQICDAVAEYRHLYLFSDFDGTLAELTPVPHDAKMDEDSRRALQRLRMERRVTVSILSGRSVFDVANRVGLPVIYGGDHGLEIHGPDFQYTVPGADRVQREIPSLSNLLRQSTTPFRGAFVEAKRYSASVHYRHVPRESIAELRSVVESTVDRERYMVRDGHLVFEVRPRLNWTKGDAVRWVLDRCHADPRQAICIGDDETDEDMFSIVPEAVNIRVTREDTGCSQARYCLHREAMPRFLDGIADAIEGATARRL